MLLQPTLDERRILFVPYEEGFLCFKLTGTKIIKKSNSVNVQSAKTR